jgi:hypothetical protein
MKLYGAIDLHSTNNVTVVIDEQDHVVYQKRLPNDLSQSNQSDRRVLPDHRYSSLEGYDEQHRNPLFLCSPGVRNRRSELPSPCCRAADGMRPRLPMRVLLKYIRILVYGTH